MAFCVLLLSVCALTVQAGTFTVFGPQSFQRDSGTPVAESVAFSVIDPTTTYTLNVTNGGIEDDTTTGEMVSSSIVIVNGVQILGQNNFSQNIASLSEPVGLLANNAMSVELWGKPGGVIAIEVIGVDNIPPLITASIFPQANSNGWYNSDVTVSFECSDLTSGIKTCPTPVTVSIEGLNQVVSGTAEDNAGNTATASVTLNIDKTLPLISSSLDVTANAAGWHNTDVVVSYTCSDALSGVADCPLPVSLVTEGESQVVTADATDNAGNIATSTVSLNIDKTVPMITASVTPLDNNYG